MDETTLKRCDKQTLKTMALNRGLQSEGFNGRTVSKMRKQDFIDFIIETSGFEDNLFQLFQNFMFESNPIFSILDLDILNILKTVDDVKGEERVPEDVDEKVPVLKTEELVKHDCDSSCLCEICQKNILIKKDNEKVNSNLINIENNITCVVCKENVRNVMFTPCNHLATCITCSKSKHLTSCPLCRKAFDSSIRVFY